MKVNKIFKQLHIKTSIGVNNPNYYHIPKTKLKANADNAVIFNTIYRAFLDEFDEYTRFKRTPSGGICLRNLMFPAYDLRGDARGVELTILTGDAMARVIFSAIPVPDNDKVCMSGSEAFREFKKTCEDFGIDFTKYEVDVPEGLRIKELIESPLIKMEDDSDCDKVFENVHHLDYHSSYPTGLINTHPEFKEAITYMYEKRHEENGKYKSVLNNSIGYMQSQYVGYKYALLSKDAINDNYNRILNLAHRLKENGRKVISYNTDGIWYQGDIFHDIDEGNTLGTWANDHTNCKFRAKSSGSYEYIEDGKYYPVVRGSTVLDRVKSRDKWSWGDIYQEDCKVITYKFDKKEGIIYG